MVLWLFSVLVFGVSCLAGLVGSLTGLGGGIVLIPALIFIFDVDIHYAIGASLISVIATSCGTALAYLKGGYTNVRIGMFLESGAVVGALVGAFLVPFVPNAYIAILLGLVLIFSSFFSLHKKKAEDQLKPSHTWALAMKFEGTYPTKEGVKGYHVFNVPLALGIMSLAGILSGLLGIGAGALKVLAMDFAMRLPYKVSTTTSNFIIGITASVGAGLYFIHGYIDPLLLFPVLPGVLIGAYIGAKILALTSSKILRIIFSIVIFVLAVQLLYKGVTEMV